MAEEGGNMSEWVAQMLQQQSAQLAQMQEQQAEARQQHENQMASIQAQQNEARMDVRNAMSTIRNRLTQVEAGPSSASTSATNTNATPVTVDTDNSMTTTMRIKPHLPNIDKFDAHDLSMYPQFEGLLKAKLEIDGNSIGGEREQVWYAFGRLAGDASARIFPWITYAQQTDTFTVEQLFVQMRTAFADPRQQQKALAELNRAKQRGLPFNEFLNNFNRTILEAQGWGWEDVIKKGYLKSALDTKLLGATVGMKEEDSYEGYCSQLRMVNDQMTEINEVTARKQWVKAQFAKRANANAHSSSNADRMDWEPSNTVGAVRTKGSKNRKHDEFKKEWATPAQLDQRKADRVCYRCGVKGHGWQYCDAKLNSKKSVYSVKSKPSAPQKGEAKDDEENSDDAVEFSDSGNE